MTDASEPATATIFFLGADTALFEALHGRLAERRIELRGFRTVAGMMVAADHWAAPVLVLDLAALPLGRDPHRLVDRLEESTGVRPLLVLLGATAPQAPDAASAAFRPPYDTGLLVTTLVELAGTRPPSERRVLAIGDSPVAEAELIAVLHRAGFRCEQVAGQGGVIEAIERFRPSLVLVDLDTLVEGARELTAQIRDHAGCESLPIVFLSADSPMERGVDALHIGGDDYLVKPVAPEALVSAVERGIAGAAPAIVSDGQGAVLLDWYPLLRRLDQAIRDDPAPGPGQAILYIRADDIGEGDQGPCPWREAIEARLRGATGPGDRGAWWKDEALVLWARRESDQAVAALAEEIHRGLSGIETGPGARAVTFSIGIAPFLPPADMAQTLVSRAQAAQGQARSLGGNRIIEHVSMLEAAQVEEDNGIDAVDAALLPLIRRALGGEGFRLVFQPILPLRQSGRERYEALLRLHSPAGAIIPPLVFLPVAERHNLLCELDRWVLGRALLVLKGEREAGRRVRLLIHQTAESLAEPDWLPWVRGEILKFDLVKHRPVLELNARSILVQEERVRPVLPALAKLGIEICLGGVTDDHRFVDLVSRHQVACVKLARELAEPGAVARLRSTVKSYRRRGVRAIASGIEDPDAIARVWSSGVDYIQGNFIQFPEDSLSYQFEERLMGTAVSD